MKPRAKCDTTLLYFWVISMSFFLRSFMNITKSRVDNLNFFIQQSIIVPQLCLSGLGTFQPLLSYIDFSPTTFLFAAPKKRVSKSKKRMKNTLRYRIKAKPHVILDKRTGEMTLSHRLPFNWKKYIPQLMDDDDKLPLSLEKFKK